MVMLPSQSSMPEVTDFGRAVALFNTPEEKHSVSLEHSLCQDDRVHPSSFQLVKLMSSSSSPFLSLSSFMMKLYRFRLLNVCSVPGPGIDAAGTLVGNSSSGSTGLEGVS